MWDCWNSDENYGGRSDEGLGADFDEGAVYVEDNVWRGLQPILLYSVPVLFGQLGQTRR